LPGIAGFVSGFVWSLKMIFFSMSLRNVRAMLHTLAFSLALVAANEVAAAIALTWFARELQGVMA
jgi:hypothetical protein